MMSLTSLHSSRVSRGKKENEVYQRQNVMNLRIFEKYNAQAEPIVERHKSLNQLLVYDVQDETIKNNIDHFNQKTLSDFYFKVLEWEKIVNDSHRARSTIRSNHRGRVENGVIDFEKI